MGLGDGGGVEFSTPVGLTMPLRSVRSFQTKTGPLLILRLFSLLLFFFCQDGLFGKDLSRVFDHDLDFPFDFCFFLYFNISVSSFLFSTIFLHPVLSFLYFTLPNYGGGMICLELGFIFEANSESCDGLSSTR